MHDTEALMISLTNVILDTLNIHAPVKMKGAKSSCPCPWLTEELIMKVWERKKLHLQLTRNPTNEALWENHRRARATARKLDRMLRNAYFTQQCSGTSDQRKLWAIMNCVTGRSKKRHTPKASLDDLSQVFGDIVTDPNRPPELQAPSGPLSRSSFTVFKPVATADIAKCLGAVDTYKATGSDGVPGVVLRNCADIIAPHLAMVINSSFSMATVPKIFECSHVCPLSKSGDKSSPRNYRPVSLLPIASRILE